jgi:hypothetical protein
MKLPFSTYCRLIDTRLDLICPLGTTEEEVLLKAECKRKENIDKVLTEEYGGFTSNKTIFMDLLTPFREIFSAKYAWLVQYSRLYQS